MNCNYLMTFIIKAKQQQNSEKERFYKTFNNSRHISNRAIIFGICGKFYIRINWFPNIFINGSVEKFISGTTTKLSH